MNRTIKLSVSSVLLAGFMTGCSQQQFQVDGQQIAGGQQVLGGQQLAGGQQALGGQQRSMTADSQVQDKLVPSTLHAHDMIVNSNEHAHDVAPKQRAYVPLPELMKDNTPTVFMYDQPKPVHDTKPVYYDDDIKPAYYEQAKPAALPQQNPVVRHKGIGMPPAQPGQCFAKVNTPAKFKNVVKRIQVSPAVNKRVKVRGPQYTYISKRELVRPATHRNQYIPAQYRNVSKQVLVKPAHYAWQKGKTAPVTRIDNMTGEILCLVKIPAVYRTVNQKVVVRPAQRVKRHVPAVYRTVKEKKLSSPAVFRNINTPAKFVNKTYKVQTDGPRQEWKPIVCKAPNGQNTAIQRARPVVSKRTPANQQQLTTDFQKQQQQLHQQWLKQEGGQSQSAGSQQRQHATQSHNAKLLANQQRRAEHAIKEKQRIVKAAQQRKLAQQARLRQVQIAKQKRSAQHQANLQAQRKAAQMRKLNRPQPSYAQPKAKIKTVIHTPKKRAMPKSQVSTPQTAGTGDDNTPLTRANAVFRIQKALLERGFNPGAIDGKLGPTTVKALTAFQETKGLKTGTLNRDTLSALNLVK